jgi:mevalonate kinase
MNISMSLPGKTFLSGEYAVLQDAQALVLNTGPRFTFTARQASAADAEGIPAGSPAGLWLAMHRQVWQGWQLEFNDPHHAAGGFGASSAQFIFAHTFTTFLQASVTRALAGLALHEMYEDYQESTGGLGSGVDVLAQTVGGVAHVDRATLTSESRPWPFADLDFAIVRTKQKMPTHEHLANLPREALVVLREPALAVVESFSGSSYEFVQQVQRWSHALFELQLQAAKTTEMLDLLRAQPWCKACKGCGALGADTLLLLFAPADRPNVEAFVVQQDWPLVATSADLGPGLQMNWSGQ